MAPTTTPTAAPTTTTTAAPATTAAAGYPVAAADSISVEPDRDTKLHVLDNDEPGGAALNEDALEIVTGPRHAEEVRVHGDHLHYRSVEDYVGTDTIRYRVCNTDGLCDEATVTIAVAP